MKQERHLSIEMLSIDELQEYENNARAHGETDVRAIKDSIEAFGFNDPIGIWSDDNVIVEGHGRLMAARSLGMTEVPCVRLDHLTDEERRAYALAHNRTAEMSKWDFAELNLELAGIKEIDMSKLGFKEAQSNEKYQAFEDKFDIQKTTDDCYTPQLVYAAVAEYVARRYDLKRENFVRPFYPGGDYENANYASDAVVVDNPPFSILSEIISFYKEKSIKFFLFAPGTMLMRYTERCTVIAAGATVEYENGAKVATAFITNLEDPEIRIRTSPELGKAVQAASDEAAKENHKQLPKYEYPDNVVTSATMNRWSRYGIEQSFRRESSIVISELDAQKEKGKGIYGSGLLLSEKAAAEKAAAEKAAAEKWQLSERERAIVATLK